LRLLLKTEQRLERIGSESGGGDGGYGHESGDRSDSLDTENFVHDVPLLMSVGRSEGREGSKTSEKKLTVRGRLCVSHLFY
jgi:hypothetical protein